MQLPELIHTGLTGGRHEMFTKHTRLRIKKSTLKHIRNNPFVYNLPGALEALKLLFVDDVKMVTQWTQNMRLRSSLIAAWDVSKK